MGHLVLMRHGQSVWNAENRFTGWVDVALTDIGRREAAQGARRLRTEGVTIDVAFTSTLDRAVETGRIVLDGLDQPELVPTRAWQLNERYYGALTGRDKAQTAQEFGADQVHRWRRSYTDPPPGGESLEHTAARVLPYFDRIIRPTLVDATVLVAAHGNSLRAVVMVLESLDEDQVVELEIATGVPLVYTVEDGRVIDKRTLAG